MNFAGVGFFCFCWAVHFTVSQPRVFVTGVGGIVDDSVIPQIALAVLALTWSSLVFFFSNFVLRIFLVGAAIGVV